MGSVLSEAAQSVWAKAGDPEDATWLPLWRHLDDTADVAATLWDSWLPDSTKSVIAAALPGEADDARALLVWLAGVHDVGKVSPAFAVQLERHGSRHIREPLLLDMQEQGFDFGDLAYVWSERAIYRHELASFRALLDWLQIRGWSRKGALLPALVVGGHHGRPPTGGQAELSLARPELLGTGLWSDVRVEHLERSVVTCGVVDRLDQWVDVRLPIAAQVVLSAGVIMADWIASGLDQFPRGECHVDPDRVCRAMDALQLPEPWRANPSDLLSGFASRFDLPDGTVPRPLQREVVAVAAEVPAPGLIVVEAPMGEGKTEAALLAVETVAARTGAGGLFVALPTRATASAMFPRMTTWIRGLGGVGSDGAVSVMLAHGKASLDERFMGIPRAGTATDPAGSTDTTPDDRLAVHRWMTGRKKSMLASFTVGTIDQLLFAGLKSKHLVLRHLALSNKIVVIDEVHSYDVFMSVYVDIVLEWLGAYRVPVVLLSATLPADRRRAMLAAYERGRADSPGIRSQIASCDYADLDADIGYPVVLASAGARPLVRPVRPSGRTTRIAIERLDDDAALIAEALDEALAGGGVAAVVHNTVRRVQQTADHLRASMSDTEVIVAHSRFVDAHRARLDHRLLELFGPNGTADRLTRRYVVVASQVIEQSLDVDFDLMVADLAPIDLVLQRLGRLHRHHRGDGQSQRAPALRRPRCLLTGVEDWTTTPPKIGPGTRAVYSPYVLYRSLAQLVPHLDGRSIELPNDIAPLVQSVYGEGDVCPPAWSTTVNEARVRHDEVQEGKKRRAKTMRLGAPHATDLLGWLDDSGDGADEDKPRGRAQVRDSEETLDAILLRRRADGTLVTLPDIGPHSERVVPTNSAIGYGLSRGIASCSIALPRSLSHPGIVDTVITELERNQIASFQAEGQYLLEGELVLVLDHNMRAELAGHGVSYDLESGLFVHTSGKEVDR